MYLISFSLAGYREQVNVCNKTICRIFTDVCFGIFFTNAFCSVPTCLKSRIFEGPHNPHQQIGKLYADCDWKKPILDKITVKNFFRSVKQAYKKRLVALFSVDLYGNKDEKKNKKNWPI